VEMFWKWQTTSPDDITNLSSQKYAAGRFFRAFIEIDIYR